VTARDQDEQDLRIDQMTVNIEKMRTDMRAESRKFLIQAIGVAAACVAAGAALAALFLLLAGKI
jgi:hypothetical protein